MKNLNDLYNSKLQDFFELFFTKMHKSRKEFISYYVLSMIVCQSVNSKKLSKQMNGQVKSSSNEQRIYDFYSKYELDYDEIAMAMFCLLKPKRVKLSIDRSNWKYGNTDINVFALTAYFHGLGVPIYWVLLEKRGNSNTEERIDLLERFIRQFGIEHIEYLTADREFIGEKWIKYLLKNNIGFFIRIKKSTDVGILGHVKKAGDMATSEREKYYMNVSIWGCNLNLSARIIHNPKDPNDDALLILTNLLPLGACECYHNRWSIECCFSCWKTRGLNIEQTHMKDLCRLKKLVAMVAIAYLYCIHTGVWSDNNQIKIPIKKHGYKEVSFFRKGLDLLDECIKQIATRYWEIVKYLNLAIEELKRNYLFFKLKQMGIKVTYLKS